MVYNKQINKINKFLEIQLVQKFSVLAVALVVVGSVAYFGTHQNQASQAASLGILSMAPTSGTLTTGSTVAVALSEDSGTDTVNAVQASVTYDATKLQYVSMVEGTAFPTIAANSTATPGTIRVGRATAAAAPATGKNVIVTLTFIVLGNTGTTSLAFDPAFSFIVRSTDNVNTLTASTGSTYALSLPLPVVSSISPATGPVAGGTPVTITGTNFVSGATVSFDATPATNVVFVNSTTITATAPAHIAGQSAISVTNPDGQQNGLKPTYNYLALAPTITTVTPLVGLPTGGTAVTITGSNFAAGATVRFGGAAASGVIVTATSITANTPARAAGVVDVVVTNPDAQSATKTAGFTYRLPAPTITAITPATGLTTGGTRVTIAGTDLVLGATVSVDGAAATSIVFVSATSLTAVVPAHAAGVVTVVVTNPDGQAGTKAAGFTYLNSVPTVSAISPLSGSVNGGTTITITGTNFLPGVRVAFGPTTVTAVTLISSTTLTVVSPAGTAGGKEIVVTNADGQSSGGIPPIFRYLSNPGDANNDGRVNAIDLSILLSNDGQAFAAADFNGDGIVGAADMAILLGRWTW